MLQANNILSLSHPPLFNGITSSHYMFQPSLRPPCTSSVTDLHTAVSNITAVLLRTSINIVHHVLIYKPFIPTVLWHTSSHICHFCTSNHPAFYTHFEFNWSLQFFINLIVSADAEDELQLASSEFR